MPTCAAAKDRAAASGAAKLSTLGGPCSRVCAVVYGIENFASSPSAGVIRGAPPGARLDAPTTTISPAGAPFPARSACAASIAACVIRQHG